MKNFLCEKSALRTLLILFLFVLLGWGIYYVINGIINPPLYVVIEFSELGPIYKKMPVYYKGYKIGVTEKIKPSDDYKTTLVTIRFYPNDLKLPNNTTAKVKPLTTTRDYIELLYPDKPSGKILQTGDKIIGTTTIDVESFMNAQYESGSIGYIIEGASLALGSISRAGNEAATFLHTLNATVWENRKNIRGIMANLNQTSKNMSELSDKLNNSVTHSGAADTSKNIQKTAENVENLTKSMNGTLKRLDSILYNINGVAINANGISADVRTSICNRNGLIGIFLGERKSCQGKYALQK